MNRVLAIALQKVPANPRFDEDGQKVPELLSPEMRHRLS